MGAANRSAGEREETVGGEMQEGGVAWTRDGNEVIAA